MHKSNSVNYDSSTLNQLLNQLKDRLGTTYDVRVFTPLSVIRDFVKGYVRRLVYSAGIGLASFLLSGYLNDEILFSTTGMQFTPSMWKSAFFGLVGAYITLLFNVYLHGRKVQRNSESEIVFTKFRDSFKDCIRVPNFVLKESLNDGKDEVTRCNQLDMLIAPPLEYCRLLLDGGTPPEYDADAKFINTMFENRTISVIALTGVTPSMWLNPTLLYHLVNSCLASLIKEINREHRAHGSYEVGEQILSVIPHEEASILTAKMISESRSSLEGLRDINALTRDNHFFTRIFFLDRLGQDTAFVKSLRDINELFKINTILVSNKKLEEMRGNCGQKKTLDVQAKERINLFRSGVRAVHEYIADKKEKYQEAINKEQENFDKYRCDGDISPYEKPEFLLVIKDPQDLDGKKLEVHTYKNGEYFVVELRDFTLIQSMLSPIVDILLDDQDLWTQSIINDTCENYAQVKLNIRPPSASETT